MQFSDNIGQIQRALARCHDMVVRRSTFMDALSLHTGERVLEIGCGGGFYAYEAAKCVGSTGRVCAIEISEEQIQAAKEYCAEYAWVEYQMADAVNLPFEGAEFDAVYCTQVLEYVPEIERALKEIHRVLRPGGRVLILATNWSSLVWHSNSPKRMERVLKAWEEHAPYPDLPASLTGRLRQAGIQPLRQTPIPIINTSYHENSFSYWIARMIRAFVVGRRTMTEAEADAWLSEFEDLEQKEEYHFSSTPVMTDAVKIA